LPTVAVPGAFAATVTAGEPTVRVRLVVPVPAGELPSWTDIAAVAVPAVVGVPLMVSVAPLAVAVSPSGSPVTAAQV
jgi:hypothetical protein